MGELSVCWFRTVCGVDVDIGEEFTDGMGLTSVSVVWGALEGGGVGGGDGDVVGGVDVVDEQEHDPGRTLTD